MNDYPTVKQNNFCQHYQLTSNGSEAYIYKKLVIVPDGEDERSYIAPIAFGPKNNIYLKSHELTTPQ